MPEGFFSLSLLTSKKPAALLAKCGACGLFQGCLSPKMKVDGDGEKGILIVGEAPGADEDKQGKPFVGKTGQYLEKVLRRHGVIMRRDCWLTNSAICRPPSNDLPPTAVDHCRPNLTKAIRELNPSVIITLGGHAVNGVVGSTWKEDVGGVSTWAGFQIPNHDPNAWICPTYHPSYVMRLSETGNTAGELLFDRHIQAAVEKESRPWDPVPEPRTSKVKCVLDPDEAWHDILAFRESPMIAFDYETDRLKPDHPDATIVSCAVSDGKRTIAYPWVGKAIRATEKLLRSDVPKVGANQKFESRWTYKEFGFWVPGWWYDTMLGAHWMDNRPNITSVKFQAYAWLGQPAWNEHIESYLKSKKGGNAPNQIREVDLNDLLVYNGVDALVEWELAVLHMKRMGKPLPKGVK